MEAENGAIPPERPEEEKPAIDDDQEKQKILLSRARELLPKRFLREEAPAVEYVGRKGYSRSLGGDYFQE